MPNAMDFFGQDFSAGVEEVKQKVTQTASKAAEFFGIDFGISREEKAPVAPSRPSGEHSIESIFPALIQAESGGKHIDEKTGKLTTSGRGAEGISQLLPSTAKKPGYGLQPVKDKSEEEYSRLGKEYLQKMYEKFGNWEKALAAYNAGVGNVIKAEGKAERFGGDWKEYLPKKDETLPYIKKILGKAEDGKKRAV